MLSWFISSGTTAAFIRVFSGGCLPGLTISVVVKDLRLKDEDKDKESSFKDKDKDKDSGRH